LYEDELKDGFPGQQKGNVQEVADSLVRQGILLKKSKKYGWKYYLNKKRRNKIEEIRK
jgi:hypothetical protein